ncbi:hypothetical protein ATKI12_3235 [Kitasatospora sp. Ki12]|uniref:hypothetical protein n=1 Tax=Kitasatospora xanthocidica TaxID=83382 RepID=UPI00167A2949|nr:hypothetical protein [Kitasatospora xanthocidica]GHF58777.1 hypothetical protein GCM10018790_40850 [Kitasatospora xanthocidica]
MPLKRTSALLATVIVAGLGLTACNNDSSSTAAPSSAAATTPAAAPASSAPAAAPSASQPAAAPATTPAAPAAGGAVPTNAVVGGKTRPADLPADIPLPPGKITLVNGAAGAYIITCEATAGDYAKYEAALKAAGFEVTSAGNGSGLAEKGESNLVITSSATTITVTYAKI